MKTDLKTISRLYKYRMEKLSGFSRCNKEAFILGRIIDNWSHGFTSFDEVIDYVWPECFDFIRDYGFELYSMERKLNRLNESYKIFYLIWKKESLDFMKKEGVNPVWTS